MRVEAMRVDCTPRGGKPLRDVPSGGRETRRAMKTMAAGILIVLLGAPALAQRPSDPALLVPQKAAALDFVSVPNPLKLPPGVMMGAPASVTFDGKGHMLVLTRGMQAFFEFEENGKFIR